MSTIEKALGNRQKPPQPPPNQVGPTLGPRSPDDPAVVNIPFDRLQAAGYLTPSAPRSNTAEEFRAIKRPLLKNITRQSAARMANANLIMVTSALEGDGKTYSSLNLAMSIAMEQDKTVLFVDADVLKASAGKVLGIPQGTPGLIDILMGNISGPEEAILHTSMERLKVMPAGTPHENATELLAGEDMYRLMQEMSSRYADRVIIFDSPPLLLTTESGVLASFMGQIVFVAAADITPQHAVQESLERIGKEQMVAVMLNMAPRHHLNLFGIGQSYGYGYGYGYDRREDVYPGATEAPIR